jgi:hypothetical protein
MPPELLANILRKNASCSSMGLVTPPYGLRMVAIFSPSGLRMVLMGAAHAGFLGHHIVFVGSYMILPWISLAILALQCEVLIACQCFLSCYCCAGSWFNELAVGRQ